MKLQNLINPKLELTVEEHKVIFIEEQTEKVALQQVIVTELPDSVFVFSTDKKDAGVGSDKCRNQFLNDQDANINKNCDGVIIHYGEDCQLKVVLCELKSTSPKAEQYETQLVNTALLVEYLVNLFNQFYKNEGQLQTNFSYVLFYLDTQRPLKMDKSVRDTVEVQKQAVPKTEKMFHYSTKRIIKYPCLKTLHNYVKWEDLIESTQFI